jgi:benzoyl-CoA reductase/2-hydroxyglutaryl-CoA dehydratase subunit BcrC/BadD/HgdB
MFQIERHIKVHEDFVASKQRKIESDCQNSRDKFTAGLQAIEQKVVSCTEKFEADISRAVKDKRTLKKAYKVSDYFEQYQRSCHPFQVEADRLAESIEEQVNTVALPSFVPFHDTHFISD